MGVAQVPDIENWIRVEGRRCDQLRGLDMKMVSNPGITTQEVATYPLGVPCDCADSLPGLVVQCQTLLFRLDIPDSHKAGAATSDQNVGNLSVPIQAVDIICAGGVVSQPEWVLDVV